MAKTEKIIVATTLTKEYRGDVCVAQIPELGLTGYGKTMDEAEQSVKELFNNLISEYRRQGVLEDRLTNHFKVSWWPAEQYDGDLEVEETAPGKY
ncbi:MAG: hypothetical protein OXE02_09150 [Chloroflexi bacterium]|nr:hypothetical protein [Chloroflexota bacterium]